MATLLNRHPNYPDKFYGQVSVTGSLAVKIPVPRDILTAQTTLSTSSATDAAKAVQLTHVISGDTLTIYAWKEDSGTDRVAATAAVTVDVLAFSK